MLSATAISPSFPWLKTCVQQKMLPLGEIFFTLPETPYFPGALPLLAVHPTD
jgi:hypothetical protein